MTGRLEEIRLRYAAMAVCPAAHPQEADKGHVWVTGPLSGRNFCSACGFYRRDLETDEAFLLEQLDLAIAHDRQPYPTAYAYEQACKALEKCRAELERTRALANVRLCAYSGPHPCHLQGDGRSLYHCPGVIAPQE